MTTSIALINVNHFGLNQKDGALPWLMLTGMPSAKRCTKWGEMYEAYKEMSRAVGVRKPQEAPKAKVLWAMKAGKDRKEEFYHPAPEERTSQEEIKRDWSCGKSISRIHLLRWTRHSSALKVSTEVGSRLC